MGQTLSQRSEQLLKTSQEGTTARDIFLNATTQLPAQSLAQPFTSIGGAHPVSKVSHHRYSWGRRGTVAFGVLVWGMETPACVHMNRQLLGGNRDLVIIAGRELGAGA